MAFDLFISYSHAVDGKLAPALQHALQRFTRPFWLSPRAMRVFRDKTTLSLTPSLWPSIEKALRDSRYFLLLASPTAANSEWVQQELACWLEADPEGERLLIAITDGEIEWDSARNDFDWDRTDALPKILANRFPSEPLYGDLRGVKVSDHLSLRHVEFADQVATIASAVRGIAKDELFGLEVRQQRKWKWITIGVGCVLVLSLLIAVYSYFQAELQRKSALAGGLAAQSAYIRSEQPNGIQQAILLAVEAERRSPSITGYQALVQGIDLLPDHVADLKDSSRPLTGRFSSNGDLLAAGFESGQAKVWHTQAWDKERMAVSHGQPVQAVIFTPDGKHLITAGNDGRACLWEVPSGQISTCFTHGPPIVSVDIDHDGRRLLTLATGDKCARHWDLATNSQTATLCHDQPATAAYFLDNKILSAARDGSILLWDLASGNLPTLLENINDILTTTISPKRHLVAVASWSRIIVWRSPDFTKLLDTTASFGSVALSLLEDGKEGVLIVGNATGETRLWRLDTGAEMQVKLPFNTVRVALNPKGDYFAAGNDSGVVGLWQHHRNPVLSSRITADDATNTTVLEFDPTGEYLLTGTHYGQLRVWRGWRPPRHPQIDHGEEMKGFRFSPKPNRAATFGNQTVRLWDYSRSPAVETRHLSHPENVNAIAFSPDGSRLATSSGDNRIGAQAKGDRKIRIWDTESGKLQMEFDISTDPASIAFNADGKRIVIGTASGEIQIRSMETNTLIAQLKQPCSANDVAFSVDDRYLGARCGDKALNLWEDGMWNQPPLQFDSDVFAFTFHPKKDFVAMGKKSGAVIKRIGDSKIISTFPGQLVLKVEFSSDGSVIATEGTGETDLTGKPVSLTHLWDISSGREIAQVNSPPTGLQSQFSPDGESIGFANNANSITIANWKVDDLIDQACNLVTRNLTEQEWKQYLPGEKYRLTCPQIRARN